ncbi:vegetative cell wall protein gp1-like [Salvia splendens]|uniref:vegetative cell wall protein gp1-like n=1 Tax=Salvia splendens TaxID=180675 RepID=UPI001C25F112|nr:vegetative cell wall protein gp1-like [Salvia splendens]
MDPAPVPTPMDPAPVPTPKGPTPVLPLKELAPVPTPEGPAPVPCPKAPTLDPMKDPMEPLKVEPTDPLEVNPETVPNGLSNTQGVVDEEVEKPGVRIIVMSDDVLTGDTVDGTVAAAVDGSVDISKQRC